ncbi:MAG: RluA family pseudouridine synthase [Spirochaetaceae bacterium]|jgi:23S rRNA pseudouridine1911/1915/1917 synthase|nr:RluA family pseudouridine synthase [Spirochaetaceae bacterium]
MPGAEKEHWSGTVAIDAENAIRLDRYAAEYLKLLSRSQIKARRLEARVNGKPAKISRVLRGGEFLELSWPPAPSVELAAENLPLTVIYEDNRVIVINKEQGMVVHPGAGNTRGTLVNALLWRRGGPGGEGEGIRPGIVHRLDKDTSGVIIAAWDAAAHEHLAREFALHRVKKTYAALVRGAPPASRGKIDARIARSRVNRKLFAVSGDAGKRAVTFYRLLYAWEGYALLALRPKTGRTHQIRVHLRHLGCPIVGDPLYGAADRRFPHATLMLHAARLSIVLPGGKTGVFAAPLPARFRCLTRALGKPLPHA